MISVTRRNDFYDQWKIDNRL